MRNTLWLLELQNRWNRILGSINSSHLLKRSSSHSLIYISSLHAKHGSVNPWLHPGCDSNSLEVEWLESSVSIIPLEPHMWRIHTQNTLLHPCTRYRIQVTIIIMETRYMTENNWEVAGAATLHHNERMKGCPITIRMWMNLPLNEGSPAGHGRLSLNGNGEGYIGNVVRGSISQRETLGCLSPAVDSSQPTCIHRVKSMPVYSMIKGKERKTSKVLSEVVTNLYRTPMWVLPTNRIQVAYTSNCAHISVIWRIL